MQKILYLHGFHSSPYSEKALIFKRAVEESSLELDLIAPQLPVYPGDAIGMLHDIWHQHGADLIGVVGSSLGGYLATYLHNEFSLPIVVVNPAVRPFDLLADYLGPQVQPITNQAYELRDLHMTQLKKIYAPRVKLPDRVWLLQQEGDEVLDFRQAVEHYTDCKISLEPNGNHGFEKFERFGVEIIEFLLNANSR